MRIINKKPYKIVPVNFTHVYSPYQLWARANSNLSFVGYLNTIPAAYPIPNFKIAAKESLNVPYDGFSK